MVGWPKKKKAEMIGLRHQQKPDLSNLVKALEDAARYGMKEGDQTIWHYGGLMKIWAEEGSIEVITPLDGAIHQNNATAAVQRRIGEQA